VTSSAHLGTTMPLLLTEADVRRCLDVASLVSLMRETLAAFSRRETRQPVRSTIQIQPGSRFYGVMPAYVPPLAGRPGGLGLKSVIFYPENDAKGLPTHLATILLLDPDTGALEALLDGRLITELRTAAVSAVSVDLLARPGAATLAIIGSGVQARSHLDAIAHVRDLREVRVWSRRPPNAERFVREMAGTVRAPLATALRSPGWASRFAAAPIFCLPEVTLCCKVRAWNRIGRLNIFRSFAH